MRKLFRYGGRRILASIQKMILPYGVLTSLYVLLRATVGENWNLVALIDNFMPWCAGTGVLLGLVIVVSKRHWLVVGLQIPIVGMFLFIYGARFQTRAAPQPPPDSQVLTVATYNIFSKSSDVDRIIDTLNTLDADIIGLQEVGFDHADAMQKRLGEAYPYQMWFPNNYNFGLGVLSRYPLSDSEVLVTYANYQGHEHLGLVRTVVELDDNVRLTIYVAHPPVPSPANYRNQRLYIYDDAPRDNQMIALRDRIQNEENPVIVLCDCNSTDQSLGYRALAEILDDAFKQAGRGLGFTVAPQPMGIPALFPLIMRVDYVWLSDHFGVVQAEVGSDDGTSDHRPVWAQLFLR